MLTGDQRLELLQCFDGLLGYDSIAEGGELGGAAQVGGVGDPAVGEALHPFDEPGLEAAVGVDGVGCGAGEGFPSGDRGGVGSPAVR